MHSKLLMEEQWRDVVGAMERRNKANNKAESELNTDKKKIRKKGTSRK